MAPPSKVPKQTSLDSFSRPGTRLAKKDAAAKEPRAKRLGRKQKEAAHQGQSRGLVVDHQGDDSSSSGQDLE